MMTLEQMKQMERIRKMYGEQLKAAEEAAQLKMSLAPRLSKEDREQIEDMMQEVREYNQYTLGYNAEIEHAKQEYIKRGVTIPKHVSHNPKGFSTLHYERANHEALELKKCIKRILSKYKTFEQQYPDSETLGITKMWKTLHYFNVDANVSKLEKLVDELRSYGEEEIYQLKKRGVNLKSLMEYTDADLGIHRNQRS